MRDITARIERYRLTRYAPPEHNRRGRFRWVWVGLSVWLVWAGVGSDHSFYRIWRLGRENQHYRLELDRLTREIESLEGELRDPRAMRERAEHQLREQDGMVKRGEIVYRILGPRTDSLTRAR